MTARERPLAAPFDAEVTPDGSPVEVYRRLPPLGEAEIVHDAVPRGATILELGCGAGRVTRELLRLGHRVTAVDDSPAMLAAVPIGANAVLADARRLDLPGRRFDVVLLGSHLVNSPGDDGLAFLRVARAHLAAGGIVVAEVYPPGLDWHAAVGRSSRIGDVTVTTTRAHVDGGRLEAEVEYAVDDRRWRQPFTAERLTTPELEAALDATGLRLGRWLDERRGWFLAREQTTPQR